MKFNEDFYKKIDESIKLDKKRLGDLTFFYHLSEDEQEREEEKRYILENYNSEVGESLFGESMIIKKD